MWTFQSYFLDLTLPYEDDGKYVRFINGLYRTSNAEVAEKLREHRDVIDLSSVIEQAKDEVEVEELLAKKERPKFKRGVKHVSGVRTSTTIEGDK